MSDIYDRSQWPAPAANPIRVLLERGDEWVTNEELMAALGLSPKRALLSTGSAFALALRDEDTAIQSRHRVTPSKSVSRAHGGQTRLFSRRAVVLAAMRTSTINAAAFRDWIADRAAGGLLDE